MSDIYIHYALYVPSAKIDERSLFEKHSNNEISLLNSPEQAETESGVLLERHTLKERPAPPDDALAYFGRGFSPKSAKQMRKSKAVISFIGLGPFDPEHRLLKSLTRCVGSIANELNAFVFDAADSLSFIPPAFEDIRVAEIERGELSANQFGVRAYRVEQGIRSVTMGLEKFGQPNLGIANFGEHLMGPVDSMFSIAIQQVIESPKVLGAGSFDLCIDDLRNSTVKAAYREQVSGEGTGKASIQLAPLESLDGDPSPLLGPVFVSPPGPELWEEQEALLKQIFGKARNVSEGVQFDSIEDAINAARQTAFNILEDTGEWQVAGRRLSLAVNLEQSREVVWIEVQSWSNGQGVGVLQSEPNAPGLSSGSQLPFDPDMIMDYRLYQANDIIAQGGIDEMVKQMR